MDFLKSINVMQKRKNLSALMLNKETLTVLKNPNLIFGGVAEEEELCTEEDFTAMEMEAEGDAARKTKTQRCQRKCKSAFC